MSPTLFLYHYTIRNHIISGDPPHYQTHNIQTVLRLQLWVAVPPSLGTQKMKGWTGPGYLCSVQNISLKIPSIGAICAPTPPSLFLPPQSSLYSLPDSSPLLPLGLGSAALLVWVVQWQATYPGQSALFLPCLSWWIQEPCPLL